MSAADPQTVALELLLGPGTHFEGLIIFRGQARIDCAMEGEISGHGLLVLGAGATAKARVDVDELVVGGEIDGDVRAARCCKCTMTMPQQTPTMFRRGGRS